jgi:hypothetical protein
MVCCLKVLSENYFLKYYGFLEIRNAVSPGLEPTYWLLKIRWTAGYVQRG